MAWSMCFVPYFQVGLKHEISAVASLTVPMRKGSKEGSQIIAVDGMHYIISTVIFSPNVSTAMDVLGRADVVEHPRCTNSRI